MATKAAKTAPAGAKPKKPSTKKAEDKMAAIAKDLAEAEDKIKNNATGREKRKKDALEVIADEFAMINKEFTDYDNLNKMRFSTTGSALKTKINTASKELSSASLNASKLTVLPIPSELTYLYRFNEFYQKSVRGIIDGLTKSNSTAELVNKTEDAERGYRIDDQSYVSKDTMNDYFSSIMSAIDSGADPSSVIDSYSSLGPVERKGLGEINNFFTSIFTNPDKDLYELAEDVGKKADFDRKARASRSFDTIRKNIIDSSKSEESILKSISTLLKAAKESGESIQFQVGTRSNTINLAAKNYSSSLAAKEVYDFLKQFNTDQVRATISSGDQDYFKLSYQNVRERQLIERTDSLLAGETKARGDKNLAMDFLKQIRITSAGDPPPETSERVFSDADIGIMSKLFIAAYTKLPEFQLDTINSLTGLGLNQQTLKGQALSIARMNMARVLENMVAKKLTHASQYGRISTPDAVYRRDRQKFVDFGDSLPDLIEKTLFSISPTGFPMDWTLTTGSQQQMQLNIGGQNLIVKDHRNFLDPNMAKSSNNMAQGDHAIALNERGIAFPRNLTSLSSALNQSKSDNAAGYDQILMTARVYNDLLGEPDWTYQASKQMGVNTATSLAREIEANKLQAQRDKIEYPTEEIDKYNRIDTPIVNKLKSDFSTLNKIENLYNLYVSTYEDTQSEYSTLKNKIEASRKISNKAIDSISATQSVDVRALKAALTKIEQLEREYKGEAVQDKIAQFYSDAKEIVEYIIEELKNMKSDGDDLIYRLRADMDKEYDSVLEKLDARRAISLKFLNIFFEDFMNFVGPLTQDLTKGEKAYRGSRIYKAQNANRKGAVPIKLSRPNLNLTNWESSYLGENQAKYEEEMKKWKLNQAEYSQMIKRAKAPDVLKDLKALEDGLKAIIAANEFVLFSEYFE